MFLAPDTMIAIVFAALVAAATYVFRVRPWLDEREIKREMRCESVTSPA